MIKKKKTVIDNYREECLLNLEKPTIIDMSKKTSVPADTLFKKLSEKKEDKFNAEYNELIKYIHEEVLSKVFWINSVGDTTHTFTIPDKYLISILGDIAPLVEKYFMENNIPIYKSKSSNLKFTINWDKSFVELKRNESKSVEESKLIIRLLTNHDTLYNKLEDEFENLDIPEIKPFKAYMHSEILPAIEKANSLNKSKTIIKLPSEFTDRHCCKILCIMLKKDDIYAADMISLHKTISIRWDKSYDEIVKLKEKRKEDLQALQTRYISKDKIKNIVKELTHSFGI